MRWVAQYNYRCDWGGPKVLWQSTSSGHVDGVSGNVDINFDYFGFCYPDDVGAYDWYVQDGHYFYVSKFGYLDGYDNGLWGPNDQLTRAQVAMVLWRAAGQPWADAEDFSDVDYGAWYADCIEWARQTGVIAGYGDTNLFGPDDPVTREQLAVMLARYAQQYVGTWADDTVLRSKADAIRRLRLGVGLHGLGGHVRHPDWRGPGGRLSDALSARLRHARRGVEDVHGAAARRPVAPAPLRLLVASRAQRSSLRRPDAPASGLVAFSG